MNILLLLIALQFNPNAAPPNSILLDSALSGSVGTRTRSFVIDTCIPYKPDTTWLFKRELPTMDTLNTEWCDKLCDVGCWYDYKFECDSCNAFGANCLSCWSTVPAPVVTIDRGNGMFDVIGKNDGQLYQCYRVSPRPQVTLRYDATGAITLPAIIQNSLYDYKQDNTDYLGGGR